MRFTGKSFITILIMLFLFRGLEAQSNQWNLWTGFTLEKELGKRWELSVNPEWRLQKLHDQSEYLFETAISYDPIPYLRIDAKYRFTYLRDQEKSNEISHQMAFDIKGKYRIDRFRFQLRTRLTNYSDFEMGDYLVNPYLRYRFRVEYDLKGVRLFPQCSVELFHQLDDMEINKLRYTIGLEYKFNHHHRLKVEYHLQDYLKKDYFKNVAALKYKFVF